MKAAILAAGKGERLTSAGLEVDKPLVPIGGQPLVARVINAAAAVGVSEASCIVNEMAPRLYHYLSTAPWPVPVHITRKTTANSLESFTTLAPYLRGEPFLLFTVDAVFRLSALERFLRGARSFPKGGVLALTRFVDDENPLYVDLGPGSVIRAIGKDAGVTPYVTAGFYRFEPDVLDLLNEARAAGLNSLRRFFGFLRNSGYPLFGIRVSKTIDVDRPKDIEAAEAYVSGRRGAKA